VLPMAAAARAVLLQLEPVLIVPPVLISGIVSFLALGAGKGDHDADSLLCHGSTPAYSRILVMTPAPTVRPPSRMAKREPTSKATGTISLTLILTLSPGMTISAPAGRSTEPVTSMVRM